MRGEHSSLNNLKRKILTTFALLSMPPLCILASPVTKITFEGLKKTDEAYLQKVLERFYGQEADSGTLHEIETALQSEGIFEKISVQAAEQKNDSGRLSSGDPGNGTVVKVSVKEKITFIPIPFTMVSDNGWMAGGMVMNMNAFGNKTMVVGGGFLSSYSLMGIFSIAKPAASKKEFGWSIFSSVSRNSNSWTDIYENDFFELKQTSFSSGASLSRKITDFTSVSAGAGTSYSRYNETSGYALPFSGNTSFKLKANAGLVHGKSDWNGWYLNSKTLSISGEYGRDFTAKDSVRKASANIIFQQPVTDRLRICADAAGVYTRGGNITDWNNGSAVLVSILPAKFSSRELAGASAGLELAAAKLKFGIFSIYANYQMVYAENTDEQYKFCQGINGGARLYLSKIAFPAFAFGISRSLTTENWYWAGSIGVSF